MEPTLQRGDSWGGEGLHFAPNNYEYAVVFMHGLGDSAHGWQVLVSLLHSIGGPIVSKTKIILPTANTIPISMNLGFPMPAWADIRGLSPSDEEDEPGYIQSVSRISKIVDNELSHGIPSTRLILGGFSQGAAVAYLTTLMSNRTFGGIVALSGWLPLALKNPAKFSTVPDASIQTPVLHCHGTDDPMVNFRWGSATVDALKSMGFRSQLQTYPGMGHSVTDEELMSVGKFILATFSGKESQLE